MSPSEPVVTFVSPQSLPFDGNFGIPAAYIAGDFITLPPFAMAPNSRPTSVNYIRRFSSMDAADRIRVAILGCGMMGQEHISYIAGYENLRLDYLCDPYEPSLEKSIAMWKQFQHASTTMQQQEEGHVPILLREEQDLLEYADKIDLLVIASPNYLHTDSIARWAPYDLTILVEKPVAVSQEQHDALTRLSEQQACDYCARIWVAMEYRYIPAIAKMLSLLPTIGALKMVTIRENRYPFLHKIGKWNRDPIKTGDTLVEKCCHFFDLFRLITGKEVSKKGVKALVQRGINYEEEEIVTPTPIIDSAYVMMPFREQQQGAKKQQQHAVMGCLELCMYAEGSRHQEEIIVTGTKVSRCIG
jgi:myo-inositol 2-dehydrogenase/D-chiro-inositol 1-dehydrogenase